MITIMALTRDDIRLSVASITSAPRSRMGFRIGPSWAFFNSTDAHAHDIA